MKTGPISCPEALLFGIHGGSLVARGTQFEILVFPVQHRIDDLLEVGRTLNWTLVDEDDWSISTVVTTPQRWRQGEVFVRIKT